MQPLQILLIEDNPTDILLAKEALESIDSPHTLHVVKDGIEAGKFLNQQNHYSGAPRPDFIFLDLNLPRKNGRELLAEIKSMEKLKSIPVIVLSTSDSPDDIEYAYQLHANCYVVKPTSFECCIEAFNMLIKFWSKFVKLPEQ